MSKKLLLVEDDDPTIKILGDELSDVNLTIINAKNGEDGLKMAKEEKPDLIVLDIIMPKMNGIKMLEKMRATDWGKKIPVILLTNLSDSKQMKQAKSMGVSDYMIKADWHIADVGEKIKKALNL